MTAFQRIDGSAPGLSRLPGRMRVVVDLHCAQCGRRFWSFFRYTSPDVSDREPKVQGIRIAGVLVTPRWIGREPDDAVLLECRACGHVPPPYARSRIIAELDSVKPDADGYGRRQVSW